jgi:hypothetical protein
MENRDLAVPLPWVPPAKLLGYGWILPMLAFTAVVVSFGVRGRWGAVLAAAVVLVGVVLQVGLTELSFAGARSSHLALGVLVAGACLAATALWARGVAKRAGHKRQALARGVVRIFAGSFLLFVSALLRYHEFPDHRIDAPLVIEDPYTWSEWYLLIPYALTAFTSLNWFVALTWISAWLFFSGVRRLLDLPVTRQIQPSEATTVM